VTTDVKNVNRAAGQGTISSDGTIRRDFFIFRLTKAHIIRMFKKTLQEATLFVHNDGDFL